MTSIRTRDRDVEIAIGTSVVIHVLLIMMLVWQWGAGLAERWMEANREVPVEKQVTLLYPEQVIEIEVPVIPEPPKPKAEPQQYIRTTQNSEEDEAPMQADFISDRNTKAASELPPDADGDPTMPTQEGIDPKRLELANRDFKDGEIMEDGATPVPAVQVTQASPPSAAAPPSILKPTEAPQQPSAPATPPQPAPTPAAVPLPVAVAKAEPLTPLEAMMKEQDESDAARIQMDRLPLEVKKAEPITPADVASLPPPEPEVAMRDGPADATPPAPPTPPSPPVMQVPDPVTRTAGPQDAAAFSPFTRTSKARGTISNRGAAAVNAAETPVGRYMRTVTSAVEKKWHTLRRRNADAVTFGNLRLRFYVMPNGRVEPPQILSDRSEADARMIDFTLQAVLEAEIPPIPENLLPMLDQQRLEVEYDVLIY